MTVLRGSEMVFKVLARLLFTVHLFLATIQELVGMQKKEAPKPLEECLLTRFHDLYKDQMFNEEAHGSICHIPYAVFIHPLLFVMT